MDRQPPLSIRARMAARRRPAPTRKLPIVVLAALLLTLLLVVGTMISMVTLGASALASAYHSYTEDLPSITGVQQRDVFKNSRILDREGNLLYELFDQDEGKRIFVRLNDFPKVMRDAVIAVEDSTFYTNTGVEPRGIARAAYQYMQSGSVQSGGSTITQQLIRQVLFPPEERTEATLQRKLKEAVLSVELTSAYKKEEILEWYMNEVYLGSLSYGMGTAAKTYFNKGVNEITLPEAAMIAGLPQAPNDYDPFRNFDLAKQRQEKVLDLMAEHGFISEEAAEEAKQEPLNIVTPESANQTVKYPHWVYYVRSVLEEKYGARQLLSAGWTITTTLDPRSQNIAEDVIRQNLGTLRAQGATNAALVAIDPWQGEIIAMVGSPDYNDASIAGQVNAAVVERQPGSSIKPIVYLDAFTKGFSPSTVVQDAPLSLPDGSGRQWRPQNFDNRFRGAVLLRNALGNSLNIPAVKVLQFVGVDDAVSFARKLGLTSLREPSQYGLAFALGGGEVRLVELATAYTVLANMGLQVPVTPILKIVDGEGKVVYENQPVRTQIVDPRAAFMVNDILSDNNARSQTFGLNSPLKLPHDRIAAAKTGTTDQNRDSWTMGYTPSLVAGVWVGRADNRVMNVLSSTGPGRIWNQFMDRALEGWPNEGWTPPSGLVYDTVCAATGLPGGPECGRSIRDWFLEERAPSTIAKLAQRSVALDRANGRLAGPDTPYNEVQFQTFRPRVSGEGFAPNEVSDRAGVNRPWEVLTPTIYPTNGPSHTPTLTPRITGTQPITRTPTVTSTPTQTNTPLPTTTPRPTYTPVPPPTATEEVPNPYANFPATVALLAPRQGQILSGQVAVAGSASNPNFAWYRVEYQQDVDGEWRTVRDSVSTTPVVNAQLDDWDARVMPSGTYRIRLTVAMTTGLALASTLTVGLQNPGR